MGGSRKQARIRGAQGAAPSWKGKDAREHPTKQVFYSGLEDTPPVQSGGAASLQCLGATLSSPLSSVPRWGTKPAPHG